MKMILILISLLSVFCLGYTHHNFYIQNHCHKEIWIGILGNSIPVGGGFKLPAWHSRKVTIPFKWSGRVWGRTGCGHGRCETGDCGGGRVQCHGAGGVPPATLAEITFDGHGRKDYYDVSLVDGYNLKIRMKPHHGTYDRKNGDHYYCGTAGCNHDLNKSCPDNRMKVWGTGGVVACKSACEAFNTDRYCCRGYYNNPKRCTYFHFARVFKDACPDAYSYAYDDKKSTFTCRGRGSTPTSYDIIFC